MEKDLLDFTRVPFETLYFDPNNPRLAPDDPPGYEDPVKLFDPDVQRELLEKIPIVYKPEELRAAIETQGWVPIDAIVVWEHPKRKGSYVVLEGNTRKYVLAAIRSELDKARNKLKKLGAARAGVAKADIDRQKLLVEHLEHIVSDTQQVTVAPVNAKSVEELLHRLPRLMGARHIQPAKAWTPYAKNRYIVSVYEQDFVRRHPGRELALDDDIVRDVATRVSQKPLETRRNIQSALAFSHFKLNYEDRLPTGKGEGFGDEDQYFFDNILKNGYAQEQFQFGKDDLRLGDEMEETLFKWAFAKPRAGKDNENIFEVAEDIRLWHQMNAYDQKNAGTTRFAKSLDVADPDSAVRIRETEADYMFHRQRMSNVDLFTKLLTAMGDLKAEALKEQASHFRPLLEQVALTADGFIKMIDAVNPLASENR